MLNEISDRGDLDFYVYNAAICLHLSTSVRRLENWNFVFPSRELQSKRVWESLA